MANNCYIILELDFDPPVEDQAVIDKRIEEKSKFWSSSFNHPIKGPEYRAYHQMLPEIKRIMSDPAERKKQAAEACMLKYGPIDNKVKIIGRKGEITKDEGSKIAKLLKVDVALVKKRVEVLGIVWDDEDPVPYPVIHEKYYKSKPQNADSFDNMKALLKSFNVDNLYDFLYADTTVKNASKQPCETLRQRASERKKNNFYKNDSVSGSGAKLCAQCEIVFKDDSSKDIYDKYLEATKIKNVLNEVREIASISGEIIAEQGEEFIGKLTEVFKDRNLATNVLTAFCKVEKIIYSGSGSEKEKDDNIRVCRCGCINHVSDGRLVCQNCGLELNIKCPKCGEENDASIKVCKCGFKLERIDNAVALCGLAEHAIQTMDFKIAQAHLDDAEKLWPGNTKVKELLEKLNSMKERLGPFAEGLKEAIQDKCFYEAKKQYDNIKKMFPEYKEPDLLSKIENAISTAGAFFNKAKAASSEKDVIDLSAKAYEECHDYPGIKELLGIHTPKIPGNLRVAPDGNTKTNNLVWDKSISEGLIYYSVIRKKDAAPINIGDGDLVGRVSMCGFNDNKINPGTCYYYAIFAERAGIYSDPVVTKTPVVNLFEISNVTIAAGDSLLQLEWDSLPNGATVEIYRISESGKDDKLTRSTVTSYLDNGLVNDKTYKYRLALSYNVNGQAQLTKGVFASGTPTKPPRAIEKLSVSPAQGDLFQVTWENPENSEIQLYCSTERPAYNIGELVSQTAIDMKMRKLALTKTSNTSGTFAYRGEELLYVVACTVKSGSVVIGSIARATKNQMVKIKSIAPVNNKINIYLDAPKNVTGFVVLYRFDQFPIDISDVKTVRKYIPLKQYQHDSAIVLDVLEPKNFYFSVFAEFKRDGEKDYSIGSEYLFTNAPKAIISYSINVSKKLFGSKMITIEFAADKPSFTLPDIDIVSGVGVVPMFKSGARPFYNVPSQSVEGSLQVQIPMPKAIEKDTFIKAFLKDESLDDRYLLQLKVKSNLKIS